MVLKVGLGFCPLSRKVKASAFAMPQWIGASCQD